MTISVIIVTWNVCDELRRCLASLGESTAAPREIIVVDNDSSDTTREMIQKEFPRVTLIANEKNEGFAGAVNKGATCAHGDVFFILNPDTRVFPDTLDRLDETFATHPRAGVIGTMITNPDGSLQHSVRAFPTVVSQIFVLLKLHNFFPNLPPLQSYYRWDFDYTREQSVDQVMGASFAVRREVFERLNGFDEAFWIWFEEVDFCKRARAIGWDVLYVPSARILHEKGRSFAQVHPLIREWWLIRSMNHYFWKHSSRAASVVLAIFYPLALVLSLGTRAARSVMRKNTEL